MNKDIQALIEREAEKYTDNIQAEFDNCDLSELRVIPYEEIEKVEKESRISVFVDGASFALSLFRWRKVEEEMPEIGIKVIVKTINGNYSISEMYIPKDCHNTVLGDKEWKGSYTFKTSITEWMPIPQID